MYKCPAAVRIYYNTRADLNEFTNVCKTLINAYKDPGTDGYNADIVI